MGNVDIRTATERDNESFELLAEQIWGDDASARAMRPPGWDRRRWTADAYKLPHSVAGSVTLMAEIDGQIAGAGSVKPGELQSRLNLDIAPGFRDRGIGEALFEALDAEAGGPYLVRQFPDDPGKIELYRSLGFRTIDRITSGWIEPSHPETAAWLERTLALPLGEVRIQPLGTEKSAGSAAALEVARLFDGGRATAGEWVPNDSISDARALEFYLAPAIADTTFCAYQGERLVGAVTLGSAPFGVEDPSSGHLCWLRVEPPDRPDAALLTDALLAHVLDAARRLGLRVSIEGLEQERIKHASIHGVPGADLVEDLSIMTREVPVAVG